MTEINEPREHTAMVDAQYLASFESEFSNVVMVRYFSKTCSADEEFCMALWIVALLSVEVQAWVVWLLSFHVMYCWLLRNNPHGASSTIPIRTNVIHTKKLKQFFDSNFYILSTIFSSKNSGIDKWLSPDIPTFNIIRLKISYPSFFGYKPDCQKLNELYFASTNLKLKL